MTTYRIILAKCQNQVILCFGDDTMEYDKSLEAYYIVSYKLRAPKFIVNAIIERFNTLIKETLGLEPVIATKYLYCITEESQWDIMQTTLQRLCESLSESSGLWGHMLVIMLIVSTLYIPDLLIKLIPTVIFSIMEVSYMT